MEKITDFLLAMAGASPIEWLAVACGLANVGLLIRRSVWNYPFGIVMVTLYAWIFYDAKLYSEALLQIYFFVLQVLGWIWWLSARGGDGLVIVERLSPWGYAMVAVAAVAGVAALGTTMDRFTDAALPYWDSTVTVLSVIAQFLLAKRILENWILWIAVDILAIGIYLTKGLNPTAALYAVFLCMASYGLFVWWRAWAKGEAVQ